MFFVRIFGLIKRKISIMRNLSVLTMLFVVLTVHAQSIESQLISPSGGNFEGQGGSGNFAMGEVLVQTLQADDNVFLTQGFVQPEIAKQTDVEASLLTENKISIYPNPAINHLNVKLKEIDAKEINIRIIDITGKLRIEKEFELKESGNEIQLEIKELSKGIYFISVLEEEKLLKRTKFYKK